MSGEWQVLNESPTEAPAISAGSTTTAPALDNPEWKPLNEPISAEAPKERTVLLDDKGITAGYPESMDSRDAEVAIRRDVYQEPVTPVDKEYKNDVAVLYLENYDPKGKIPLTKDQEDQARRAKIVRDYKDKPFDYVTGAPPEYGQISAFMSGALPVGENQKIEDLAAIYPGATMAGKLAQLSLISFLSGGGASVPGIVSNLSKTPLNLYPKLVPMVAHAVNAGSLWGIGGLVDVIAREPSWETITHPLSEAAFGALIGAAGGVEGRLVDKVIKSGRPKMDPKLAKHWRLPEGFGERIATEQVAYGNRVVAGAIVRGGWEAAKSLMNDGKIDKNELINIALNASLGAAFESINAKVVSQNLRRSRILNMERIKTEVREKLRAEVMSSTEQGEAGVVKGLVKLQEDRFKKFSDELEAFYRTFKRPDIVMTTEHIPYNISLADASIQKNYVRMIEKNVAENGMPLSEALKVAGEWLSEKWSEVEFTDDLVGKILPLREEIYNNLNMSESLRMKAEDEAVGKIETLTAAVKDSIVANGDIGLGEIETLIKSSGITDADLQTLGIDTPEDLGSQVVGIIRNEMAQEAQRVADEERQAIQAEEGDASFEVASEAKSLGAAAAYEFGYNFQEAVRAPSGSEASLLSKLDAIKDRKARAAEAKTMIEQGSLVKNYLKHRIKKYAQTETEKHYKKPAYMSEELSALPRIYITTNDNGITIDQALEEVNGASLGVNFDNFSDLIDYLREWEKREAELKAVIAAARPEYVNMRKETFLKKELERIAQGVRLGKNFTKKSTKEVQRKLRGIIENSDLEANDRDKFARKIINAQTIDQFDNIILELESKIQVLEAKALHREAVAALKKTLRGVNVREMDPVYKKKLEDLLKEYDLKNYGEDKRAELADIFEYITDNPDNNIPDYVLKELGALSKKPLRDMNYEEINLLNAAIQHAIKLNELKNRLKFGAKYAELKTLVAEAIKRVARGAEIDKDPNNITSRGKWRKDGWKNVFTVASWNMEMIADILDGDRKGPIWNVLYNGMDLAETERLRIYYDAEDFFKLALNGIDISNWSESFIPDTLAHKALGEIGVVGKVKYDKIKLPSGKTIEITPAEKIAFYLHTLNDKNMKHLREGFYFRKRREMLHVLDETDIQALAESLTDDEYKVAAAIWTYFNTIQNKKLNEVSVALNGFEIATEENYFTISTSALDRHHDDLKTSKNFSHKTLEGMGLLQLRTNSKDPLMLEDAFSVVAKSIKQVSAYVGYAEALRNAKMLVHDTDFQKAIIANFGENYLDDINDYLRKVEDTSHDVSLIDTLTTEWIQKLQVAALGLSLWTILKQPIAILTAWCEISPKYFRPWDKPTSREFMGKWSSQMRDRYTGRIGREMGEIQSFGETRQFWTNRYSIGQNFMRGISRFDYEVVGRVWRAVEREVRETRLDLEPGTEDFHKAVAERTEEVVRLTQQTGAMKDRPRIARDPGLWNRLLTMFSTQANKQYILIRRAIHEYNISKKTVADKRALMNKFALVLVFTPIALYYVDQMRDEVYGRPEQKRPLRHFILSVVQNALSNIYYISPLSNAAVNKIERGKFGGQGLENMATQTAEQFVETLVDTYNAIEQYNTKEINETTNDYKWKKSATSALDNAVELSAKRMGVNYNAIKKWILFVSGANKKNTNNEGW